MCPVGDCITSLIAVFGFISGHAPSLRSTLPVPGLLCKRRPSTAHKSHKVIRMNWLFSLVAVYRLNSIFSNSLLTRAILLWHPPSLSEIWLHISTWPANAPQEIHFGCLCVESINKLARKFRVLETWKFSAKFTSFWLSWSSFRDVATFSNLGIKGPFQILRAHLNILRSSWQMLQIFVIARLLSSPVCYAWVIISLCQKEEGRNSGVFTAHVASHADVLRLARTSAWEATAHGN